MPNLLNGCSLQQSTLFLKPSFVSVKSASCAPQLKDYLARLHPMNEFIRLSNKQPQQPVDSLLLNQTCKTFRFAPMKDEESAIALSLKLHLLTYLLLTTARSKCASWRTYLMIKSYSRHFVLEKISTQQLLLKYLASKFLMLMRTCAVRLKQCHMDWLMGSPPTD